MPETPISESAARTSSSLKGLIMAVINFIVWTPVSVGASRQYYYDCTQQARSYTVAAARRGCCVQWPFRVRPRPAIKTGYRSGSELPRNPMISTILIIGGGQAGAQAIDTLRR